MMTLPAFIPGLKRPVKHGPGVSRSQIILDVRIRLTATRRMQRRLVTTTIILLMTIEVFAVVRAFAFSQLLPPVFTQRIEIFSARFVQNFRGSVSLVTLFGIDDHYR